MPNSGGMNSFDSAIYYSAYSDPLTVPASYTNITNSWNEIAEVISINGVPMERSVTPLTHLRSPNKAAEKVPGFLDAGQNTFKLNSRKSLLAALEVLSPGGAGAPDTSPSWGRLTWAVLMPDHGAWIFCGFIKSKPIEIPEDNRITTDVTVEISGKPVFYAFA